MAKEKTLSKLTKKQKGFVKDYLDSGNGTQAALKNYNTKDYKTASVIAAENLDKPNIQMYLQDKAEDAASMIYELSQNGKMEPVRLAASKDILDRAGYKPVEKSINVTAQVNIENKQYVESLLPEVISKMKQDESNG